MSHSGPVPPPSVSGPGRSEAFEPRRLLIAGLIAIGASVVATVVIRTITVAIVDVPSRFKPLVLGSVIALTVLGVVAAVVACFVLNRVAVRPIPTFLRIVPIALVVSFIPDVAIWVAHAYEHAARASTVIPLLIMHVAVAGICLAVLPRFGSAS